MKLYEMNMNQLTSVDYQCSCGRRHSVDIDVVDISADAISNAIEYVKTRQPSSVTVICDDNTYEIAGKTVYDGLDSAGINTSSYIIKGRNGLNVAPNDSYIGETLAYVDASTDFFVAVGSGVINDITRQISFKMGRDYIVIGTAPSMDGYASVTSSLILNNIKESIPGHNPRAIFGPTDILKDAPAKMLTAGFGDVIGKYNALREWKFGHDLNNEHYCPEIVELVKNVADRCSAGAPTLMDRNEETIINTMEGLITAGLAMGLYQNTRPASGAEHHMVHYWDVDFIRRGEEHELHGNSVGIGTVVICRLYEIVKDRLPVPVEDIDSGHIRDILKKAGCMTHPREAGIDRNLFRESLLKGHTMSSKYTILTHLNAHDPELLVQAADQLCNEFYND